MKRNSVWILCCLLLSTGLYLNRAYAHIYNVFEQTHLTPPPAPSLTITAKPGNSIVLKYVALGDSLTAGTGVTRTEETYPYHLAEFLSKKTDHSIQLSNLAVPGATSADMVKNQIPLIMNERPDVVTLLIGINDIHNRVSVTQFKKNITSIVDTLIATKAHVNVITIPYLGNETTFLFPFPLYFNQQTKKYNTALREALDGKPVQILDLYTLTKNISRQKNISGRQNYYSADGFHPNVAGYTYWAEKLYEHFDY